MASSVLVASIAVVTELVSCSAIQLRQTLPNFGIGARQHIIDNNSDSDSADENQQRRRRLVSSCTDRVSIDFSTASDGRQKLERGNKIDNQVVFDTFSGVTFQARKKERGNADYWGDGMIFDADRPSGGDWTLEIPGHGNVMIISEDGDASDPDDNRIGGTIMATFRTPVRLEGLNLLDVPDSYSYMELFSEGSKLIRRVDIPRIGNQRKRYIVLNTNNVSTLKVHLWSSGAIDDVQFSRSCAALSSDATPSAPNPPPPSRTAKSKVSTHSAQLACQSDLNINFETDANGQKLQKGNKIHDGISFDHISGISFRARKVERGKTESWSDGMIFDADNPSGDDDDLGVAGRGNILIISEDGNSNNPDDNAMGGTIIATFQKPVRLKGLRIIDTEDDGSYIDTFAAGWNFLQRVQLPTTGNKGQSFVSLGIDNVSYFKVILNGSGAIDDVSVSRKCPSSTSTPTASPPSPPVPPSPPSPPSPPPPPPAPSPPLPTPETSSPTICKDDIRIWFNQDGEGTAFDRGDVIDANVKFSGVSFMARRKQRGPDGAWVDGMIFDTRRISGGDNDLARTWMKNVLIISEDNDSSDPDDNENGGEIMAIFNGVVEVTGMRFLDIESGAKIDLYDSTDRHIKSVSVPATTNGGQRFFRFYQEGVWKMVVTLWGTGAIDDVRFSRDCDNLTLAPTPDFNGKANPIPIITLSPSRLPTAVPTTPVPTVFPTVGPTVSPSSLPTPLPTLFPTQDPSNKPSQEPSRAPSQGPSRAPSQGPSRAPSQGPSRAPSQGPSRAPSSEPSSEPSEAPSRKVTEEPSSRPTQRPSQVPSSSPSQPPSKSPSQQPSQAPSKRPSEKPTAQPTEFPSTISPSRQPTMRPTTTSPSRQPTLEPTTLEPTTLAPSLEPTTETGRPTVCREDYVIDFEQNGLGRTLRRGDRIDDSVTLLYGTTIKASRTQDGLEEGNVVFDDGMIFDTRGVPSGNLSRDPSRGNILIVSATGDSSNPNENTMGGKVVISFSTIVTVNSIALIDAQEGARLDFFGSNDEIVEAIIVSAGGQDGAITVLPLGVGGVKRLAITLTDSGAIDDIDVTQSCETMAPTTVPTAFPSAMPSKQVTATETPTRRPTEPPSRGPTDVPTRAPTEFPTKAPTEFPTKAPTEFPTKAPTEFPTNMPTIAPIDYWPTIEPSSAPTRTPNTPGVPFNAPLCEDTEEVVITFDEDGNGIPLGRGSLLDDRTWLDGVKFRARRPDTSDDRSFNDGMIYDTRRPSPNDMGLASQPQQGNVFIVSEDDNPSDPQEATRGGLMEFEFEETVTVTSIKVLDSDPPPSSPGFIALFDPRGSRIGRFDIPKTSDGGIATLDLGNLQGVRFGRIQLRSSAAFDDLVFRRPCPIVAAPTTSPAPSSTPSLCRDRILIDFSHLATGEQLSKGNPIGISNIFDGGVSFGANRANNTGYDDAIIYEARTSGEGELVNVLGIASSGGAGSGPLASEGGELRILFDIPATVYSLILTDTNQAEPGSVQVFDELDAPLTEPLPIPSSEEPYQTFFLGELENVGLIRLHVNGTVAIADLKFILRCGHGYEFFTPWSRP